MINWIIPVVLCTDKLIPFINPKVMKIKKKHEYLATKLKGKKSFYSKNKHNNSKKATERGGGGE